MCYSGHLDAHLMRTIPHTRRTQIPDCKPSGHLHLQLPAVPASFFLV
jgi:hypothetical protein